MLPLSSPERLKRYHQGKETEMACEYAKRTDHGWECTVAKKSHADALFQIRAYAQKSTNGLKT